MLECSLQFDSLQIWSPSLKCWYFVYSSFRQRGPFPRWILSPGTCAFYGQERLSRSPSTQRAWWTGESFRFRWVTMYVSAGKTNSKLRKRTPLSQPMRCKAKGSRVYMYLTPGWYVLCVIYFWLLVTFAISGHYYYQDFGCTTHSWKALKY